MMKHRRGFSLVEIAIVLVLIALITGGILKARKIHEDSQFKAWIKEIKSYQAAVYTFKDRYGYLPGDYPKATGKFTAPEGVVIYNGNGNGDTENWDDLSYGDGHEAANAFQHLLLAEIVPGDVTEPRHLYPASPIGGHAVAIGVGRIANRRVGVQVIYQNVSAQYAKRLDENWDDGSALSGRVHCGQSCSTEWATDDRQTDVVMVL